ncbi:MAG: peptidoglycan-binding protein [Christensenellales bacterium]|jgi:peptidoglycan hydrolase-like protein with peptidoglycan-binding domain
MQYQANTRTLCLFLAVLTVFSLFTTALAAERYQVMREGERDAYVLMLQEKLYEMGFLKVEPTGYYGSATMDAVKKFQKKKGLTADGIAGVATQKALYGSAYTPIPSTRKVSGQAERMSSSKRYQVLMFGDEDQYVEKLQQALCDAGYLKTKPTGYFGEATLVAVIAFQKKKGLTADGIAGVATQKALYGKAYSPIPSSRKVRNSATSEDADGDFESLRRGDAGAIVQSVQQRLKKYGYFDGEATSYFGSATEAAVEAFQKINGLKVDGVVGSATYSLLFAGDPKSAPKRSSSSSRSKTEPDDVVDLGTESDIAIIEEAIRYAASFLGTPYKTGGKGPKNFDCSGFTAYVLKHVGVKASTSSKSQGNNDNWPKVSFKNLKRGDLLIFTNTRLSSIGHVGIYLGGGRFIHCSSGSAMSVTISHLEGSYRNRFLWGRRWVAEADPSVLEQLGLADTGDDTPPEAEEVEDGATDNAEAINVDGDEAITLD